MLLPKFDIFLSYKSDDANWVDQLRRELQKRGVKVWLDSQEIRPGDLFAEALEKGLDSCRSVGLVVTEKSMMSGWVKEEYYRALSLSKAHHLHLIPLLLDNTPLPGFLANRQYVDFRSNSDYDQKIDALIWPGITGRKVQVFLHSILVWDDLDDWVYLMRIIKESSIELCTIDEPWNLKEEVLSAIRNGYRTVVISDPFRYWPWRELGRVSVKRTIKELFDLRELTRGTEDETVFALYIHPDVLSKAPHKLDKGIQERLSHYYHIPMSFFDAKDGKKPTAAEVRDLRLSWKKTWYQIQTQLLASERRFFGKTLD